MSKFYPSLLLSSLGALLLLSCPAPSTSVAAISPFGSKAKVVPTPLSDPTALAANKQPSPLVYLASLADFESFIYAISVGVYFGGTWKQWAIRDGSFWLNWGEPIGLCLGSGFGLIFSYLWWIKRPPLKIPACFVVGFFFGTSLPKFFGIVLLLGTVLYLVLFGIAMFRDEATLDSVDQERFKDARRSFAFRVLVSGVFGCFLQDYFYQIKRFFLQQWSPTTADWLFSMGGLCLLAISIVLEYHLYRIPSKIIGLGASFLFACYQESWVQYLSLGYFLIALLIWIGYVIQYKTDTYLVL